MQLHSSNSRCMVWIYLLFLSVNVSALKSPVEAGDNQGDRGPPDSERTRKDDANGWSIDRVNVDNLDMDCSSSSCLNGGTCTPVRTGMFCKCTAFYAGENCATEPQTNIARLSHGANCTSSSTRLPVDGRTYHCEHIIDEGFVRDNWWSSLDEQEGSWVRIYFSAYYRVRSVGVIVACSEDTSPYTLELGNSDYTTVDIELLCYGTDICADRFWRNFDLVPIITSYLHVQVSAACDPEGPFVTVHSVQIFANDAPLANAASINEGATCTASSAYNQDDFGCQNAIDGVDAPGLGSEWATDGEGAGAWIQIDLKRTSTVIAVDFLQRCSQMTQNDLLQLDFSDASSQQVDLECFTTGQDPLDCDGQYWQQFDLQPHVVTSFVRVTIMAVCSSENNGFREIRVFSLRDDADMSRTPLSDSDNPT